MFSPNDEVRQIKQLGKFTKAIVLIGAGLFLLVGNGLSSSVLAAHPGPVRVAKMMPASTPVPAFSDEFDADKLDLTRWEVVKGTPQIGSGKLTLAGGTTRAEIQTKAGFQSGTLHMAIESSDWQPQVQSTDSSFGFEIWAGANGQCHQGVVFIASGHLGVLRSIADAYNNCLGDPVHQVFVPISNWETVRAANTIFLTLMWSPYGVTLHVNDGGSNSGYAAYDGEAVPDVPLEIRLNADTGETFETDFVRVNIIEERTVLVDDFVPQPEQGKSFWPHNRLGGDRGPIEGPGNGSVVFGAGVVTATVTGGTNSTRGVWTSVNHPIRDCRPLNFAAIFPPQIKSGFQGRIVGLRIKILDGQGTFQIVLQKGEINYCPPQVTKWLESSLSLSGGPQEIFLSLPPELGEIGNLNWHVTGSAGDFVVVDRVELLAELPQLDAPERAFLWSYAILLANWDPGSGLSRDSARFVTGEFDNISASGMQAAAAIMAWHLGLISADAATEIVTKTTQALLALPECHGLWPHFVTNHQIVSGTEWSSIDSVIALTTLIEARQALGLDTAQVEAELKGIEWTALILGNGSLSHGYVTDCSERIEDQDGGLAGGWGDFGTESWLVNWGFAAATGNVASFDHSPPTVNGSGFIDELAWLLAPPPCDRWDTAWHSYRQQAVNLQLDYYQAHPNYGGPPRLFGLSAAEVPDLSAVTSSQIYQAFGVGGETQPNDGTELLAHAVIIPHYAAMVASLQPSPAIAFWEWLEIMGLFTPGNNVESFTITDNNKIVWNSLRGSWNLSLQTLGWGRRLAGSSNPLYESLWRNDTLKEGYETMRGPTCRSYLPILQMSPS